MSKSISVIIPCYNGEKFIKKTIESVINQTVKCDEIIVIDDNSTDNTKNILEKIKISTNLIRVITLRENKGVAYSRNLGVNIAKGKYILFMDADDLAEKYLIEKYLYKIKLCNTNWSLLYSAYQHIDKVDKKMNVISTGFETCENDALGYSLVRNYIISTSGVLVKKSDFLKVRGFDENIRYSEDWDLWLRLAQIGGFLYIDEPLVNIRRHENNTSSKVGNMIDGELNILKKYDLNFIENAINKRKLNLENNVLDFVSILFKLKYFDEAMSKIDSLINKKIDSYQCYFLKGIYYLNKGNMDKALQEFLLTVNLNKQHGAALNNIGAIYLLKGETNKSKKYIEIALSIYPEYLDAKHNFNIIYKDIDDFQVKFTYRELRKTLISYIS